MRKLSISKEELETLYNEELTEILEQCDWIDYIDSNLVCTTISCALKRIDIEVDPKKLHEIYLSEVKSLNIGLNEWVDKYKVPQIIELIYNLIETKYPS